MGKFSLDNNKNDTVNEKTLNEERLLR